MQNSAKSGNRNRSASWEGPILINNRLSSGVERHEMNLRKRDTAVGKNLELMYNAKDWSETQLQYILQKSNESI